MNRRDMLRTTMPVYWSHERMYEKAKPDAVITKTAANTGSDPMTTAHMRNWLECQHSRKETHAPVEAGYQHSIACIRANAAVHTGERVTFDTMTQELMAGRNVFHL